MRHRKKMQTKYEICAPRGGKYVEAPKKETVLSSETSVCVCTYAVATQNNKKMVVFTAMTAFKLLRASK
jgi:hypothetical protein